MDCNIQECFQLLEKFPAHKQGKSSKSWLASSKNVHAIESIKDRSHSTLRYSDYKVEKRAVVHEKTQYASLGWMPLDTMFGAFRSLADFTYVSQQCSICFTPLAFDLFDHFFGVNDTALDVLLKKLLVSSRFPYASSG
ncbi:MAG: hypothetical protein Q7S32_04135 [bacterium]|nr:hypothetical protein [bacterium]